MVCSIVLSCVVTWALRLFPHSNCGLAQVSTFGRSILAAELENVNVLECNFFAEDVGNLFRSLVLDFREVTRTAIFKLEL